MLNVGEFGAVRSGLLRLLELSARARDPRLCDEVPSTSLSGPLKLGIFVTYSWVVLLRRPPPARQFIDP